VQKKEKEHTSKGTPTKYEEEYIMKKVTAIIVSLVLMMLMMSNASAASIAVGTDPEAEIDPANATVTLALTELDAMAASAGYEADPDAAGCAVKGYTCTVSGIKYTTFFEDGFVYKSIVDLGGEIPGSICRWPAEIDLKAGTVTMEADAGLFNDFMTVDSLEKALTENGYQIDELAPVTHYNSGNEIEGSSITFIGGAIQVYNYGADFGDIFEYEIQVNGDGVPVVAASILDIVK